MKINRPEAIKLARKYKIDLDVIPIEEWQYGLNVELEHGSKLSKITNVTKNNKDMTSKIVISHLLENHQYYKYLKKMEEKMDKIWAKKNKPDIFLE